MEMFRLYLLNLIKSGESSKKKIVSKGLPARTEFDRRTYERFNTKDKHMMLMNEQDIFFIRDISKRGFNVEVSDRAFDRLTVGDKYKCRMRYLGEIYTCIAEVRWKKDRFVGFELKEDFEDVVVFFTRLILPMKIAASLQLVKEKSISKEIQKNTYWYHGIYKTNVYIQEQENGKVKHLRRR